MKEHSFENIPDVSREFDHQQDYQEPLKYDALQWEPVNTPEPEEPSEKHAELHLTPGGMLEQEVHTELDQAARARIAEAHGERSGLDHLAEEQPLDFAGEFDVARRNAWGWDPDSRLEYEKLSEEKNEHYDQQPFETGKRFQRESERERCDEWER